MMNERKVILYIAISLDGYIAKNNDDLSFLSIVEKEGEDYGYFELIDSVDTILMGRKTYDWIINNGSFPYKNKNVFVLSRTAKPSIENINFYSGNLSELIINLKNKNGQHIFLVGGAEIVTEMLKYNLVDEFIISIIPIIIGNGVRLFQSKIPESRWKLIGVKHFETGLVQIKYRNIIFL